MNLMLLTALSQRPGRHRSVCKITGGEGNFKLEISDLKMAPAEAGTPNERGARV